MQNKILHVWPGDRVGFRSSDRFGASYLHQVLSGLTFVKGPTRFRQEKKEKGEKK